MQLRSTIDIRYRSLVDISIYCEKTPEGYHYEFLDEHSGKTKNLHISFEKARKFYGFYDTNETISDTEEDEYLGVIETKDERLARMDKIVNEMLEDDVKLVHGNIKVWLLRHKYNEKEEALLYTLLKEKMGA